MNYLEVDQLTFSYDGEQVLSDISFVVPKGEMYILTGENGAAKSTLLRSILGLLTPDSGNVMIPKKNNDGESFTIGYLPQQIASFNSGFPSTVYELVASGRFQKGRWFKRLTAHDHMHIEKALKSVGMWDYRKRQIGQLSGGQKQRICLARIFALNPDLLILDEPTTGMDVESRKEFIDLLRHSCHKHGKSVLMVTHHDDEIAAGDGHIRLERREDLPWKCFSIASCRERSSVPR
ncbi:metal ABC transporter ATP-binding protein [Atopobacter phocae]|uniref:metal ABC transporter ATP-binding protein n=1 Tax=Atopobacter phocae TaxID=136492 RepID=UPI00046F1457|nr:metal ABC transporter ATP-binding protein [Atopobacter phocae]